VAVTLKGIGEWFLVLTTYAPDLSPFEMASSRLKTLIRKSRRKKRRPNPASCWKRLQPFQEKGMLQLLQC
jgi:hypothetical protein